MNKTREKTRSLALLGLVLGLILSSCSQITPKATLEPQAINLDLYGIKGTKGKQAEKLFANSKTNCPIDQFDIPGQGWRARGGTGGLAVLQPPYATMPTAITSPEKVGKNLYNLANPIIFPISDAPPSTKDVSILVVDDFNGDTTVSPAVPPVYKIGGDVFNLPARGFSADLRVRLDQLDRRVKWLENTAQLSHGALVMNHISALIFGTGQYEGSETDISDGNVSFKHLNTGNYIYVTAVDTEDLDTEIITPRMYEAIVNALDTNNQIIVNMSFSIVPCTVRDNFDANRKNYPTFEAYANAVAAANDTLRASGETPDAFRARVYEQLVTPIDSDPLHTLIKSDNFILGNDGNLLYISAAGNFGLGYSMYPAAWPEVVSASSNDAGLGLSEFSNRGEVMLTGAWYSLTDPANINSTDGSGQENVVYAGTSFASPALAVFSAFDLAQSTPRCEAEFDSGAPIPDIAHSTYDDKPLDDAISTYCD